MRISDWSSDVCSSDLGDGAIDRPADCRQRSFRDVGCFRELRERHAAGSAASAALVSVLRMGPAGERRAHGERHYPGAGTYQRLPPTERISADAPGRPPGKHGKASLKEIVF